MSHKQHTAQSLQIFRFTSHGLYSKRYNLLIKLATHPAPKPLSILTTDTPEAHEFNIPKRGCNAAKMAPIADTGRYGNNRLRYQPTHDAGQCTPPCPQPPQTRGLFSNRSNPTHSTDVFPQHRHHTSSQRHFPSCGAVTAASSATGISDVPAEITITTPLPVIGIDWGAKVSMRGSRMVFHHGEMH